MNWIQTQKWKFISFDSDIQWAHYYVIYKSNLRICNILHSIPWFWWIVSYWLRKRAKGENKEKRLSDLKHKTGIINHLILIECFEIEFGKTIAIDQSRIKSKSRTYLKLSAKLCANWIDFGIFFIEILFVYLSFECENCFKPDILSEQIDIIKQKYQLKRKSFSERR